MDAVIDPFHTPITAVNVRVIENGYVLHAYAQGRPLEWYCINLEEVMEKMSRYI